MNRDILVKLRAIVMIILLVALAWIMIGPLLNTINRIEPFILGLPFFMAMLLIIQLVMGLAVILLTVIDARIERVNLNKGEVS